jgi:hypothetical protein
MENFQAAPQSFTDPIQRDVVAYFSAGEFFPVGFDYLHRVKSSERPPTSANRRSEPREEFAGRAVTLASVQKFRLMFSLSLLFSAVCKRRFMRTG